MDIMSELAFLVVFLMFLGALLLIGCILISTLIMAATADYMQNGWTFTEAFKKSREEWK
jgi:flagellar biosynthesis protein FlhB